LRVKQLSEKQESCSCSRKQKTELMLSSLRLKIKNSVLNTKKWVLKHWVAYSYIKGVIFLLWMPVPVLLGFLFNYSLNLTVLSALFIALFCFFPFFFILDTQRVTIAKENAIAFLKAEKVEKFFIFSELFLVSVWLISATNSLKLHL
jgi:hypothetical protein